MLSYSVINFEIQKYYQSEPIFRSVYTRYNPPSTIRNGAYVLNLDK